jgi:hypothetical protein
VFINWEEWQYFICFSNILPPGGKPCDTIPFPFAPHLPYDRNHGRLRISLSPLHALQRVPQPRPVQDMARCQTRHYCPTGARPERLGQGEHPTVLALFGHYQPKLFSSYRRARGGYGAHGQYLSFSLYQCYVFFPLTPHLGYRCACSTSCCAG